MFNHIVHIQTLPEILLIGRAPLYVYNCTYLANTYYSGNKYLIHIQINPNVFGFVWIYHMWYIVDISNGITNLQLTVMNQQKERKWIANRFSVFTQVNSDSISELGQCSFYLIWGRWSRKCTIFLFLLAPVFEVSPAEILKLVILGHIPMDNKPLLNLYSPQERFLRKSGGHFCDQRLQI